LTIRAIGYDLEGKPTREHRGGPGRNRTADDKALL
jgi:hypothetical protein